MKQPIPTETDVRDNLVDIREVMLVSRTLPDEYINEAGNYPTAEFVSYCKPLIGDVLPRFVSFRDRVMSRV